MRESTDRQRIDGATLACVYAGLLLIIPARLVLSKIPLTMPPSLLIALGLGVLWTGTHFVNTLSIGKGRNMVRTALVVYLCAHLSTFAVATRRFLPPDELKLGDSAMVRVLGTVAIAVFICDGIMHRDRLDRLLKLVVGAVSVVAFVGLLQFALGVDLAAYVSLPGLRDQDTGYSAIESRSIFRRPTGTTNHPIEFGLVCAATVPLATHYLFQALDSHTPVKRWYFCLSIIGLGAILSLSRTAILGLVVGAIVMVSTLPRRRKMAMLTIGGGAFIGIGVAVPGLLGTIRGMFVNIGQDPSVSGRTDDYETAGAQIDLNPLLGRGFGTYIPTKYQFLDNQYLLTLVENGYIGLFALIGIFLSAIFAAVAVRRLTTDPNTRGLAAALIAALLVIGIAAATFDMLSFGIATGMAFLLIGASGALLRVVKRDAPPAVETSRAFDTIRALQPIRVKPRPPSA